MTTTERQYRKLLEQHTAPRGRGRRYPATLRAAALAQLRARQAEGAKLAAVARELGLRTATLTKWAKASASPTGSKAAFRPVRLVARPAGADPERRFTVLGPAGLRIEGLDLASLAELLRSLA